MSFLEFLASGDQINLLTIPEFLFGLLHPKYILHFHIVGQQDLFFVVLLLKKLEFCRKLSQVH